MSATIEQFKQAQKLEEEMQETKDMIHVVKANIEEAEAYIRMQEVLLKNLELNLKGKYHG